MAQAAEVTQGRFKGYGFEIAVSDDATFITPEQAVRTWMANPLHREVILQQGSWRDRRWRAMGVGLYRGYAVAWFSDSASSAGAGRPRRSPSMAAGS